MPAVRSASNSADLSNAEARRIALAAQGFARRTTASRSGWDRIGTAIDDMNLLQLDSVNVLTRSHYLPVFSRIGDYDRAALDRRGFAHGAKRQLFEYWAHEASLLPLRFQPLLRWRMERARKLEGYQPARAAHLRSERAHQKKVLKEIERRGPLAAADLEDPGERSGPWWGWHRGKDTLEYLFRAGLVTTAFRRGAFERVYDLTERVIPAEILNLPTPPLADAMREQAEAGARAFGIATEFDIRDYFRLPVADARRAIAELVESGRLRPVTVEGWDKTAYLHADAAQPATVAPTALLSPFDPLVWFRPRTERIFDFHYRIEIYTPEPKRKFGYYVLPFLHQGRIVGRVDLKSDRAAGVLVAKAAHAEKRGGPAAVPALATELRRMASWLDLGDVRAEARGDLGPLLVKELAAG